jgi:hypothetical protein
MLSAGRAEGRYGDLDAAAARRLVAAGVNYFEATGLEQRSKELAPTGSAGEIYAIRQELRRRFVASSKALGVRYGHALLLSGSRIEDEKFLGGAGWLDEPFAHFPGEPKLQISKATSPGEQLVASADAYFGLVKGQLDHERKGGREEVRLPGSANITESMAWYDLKAGCRSFWYEALGKLYLSNIHFFNEYFDLDIPETPQNSIRLSAALCRGAADHFGRSWGVGIYGGTPPEIRKQLIKGLYDRGATHFFLWAYHEDGALTPVEALRLAHWIATLPDRGAPTRKQATVALLLPKGYHIPLGIYISDLLRKREPGLRANKSGALYADSGLWKTIRLSKAEGNDPPLKMLERFGVALRRVLESDEEFDILIDDEALKPGYLGRYRTVVRVADSHSGRETVPLSSARQQHVLRDFFGPKVSPGDRSGDRR